MSDRLRAFLRHPSGIIGLGLLLVFIGLAACAPLMYPLSPWEMTADPFSKPFTAGLALGSDMLGRDIGAGIAHGARVSLIIGLASTAAALFIGVTIGAIAGFCGGWIDDALMRLTELFQTIPSFVLAVVLVAILTPNISTIILAIAIVSWPPLARLTRGQFLSLRNRDFVRAARCQGESEMAILWRHVLPNALSPIIVAGSLTVATAILLESALSFLGLGDPNVMSWGFMVGAGRTVIRQAWWMSVFPGLAILFTVLGINLLGEGLNDALNPRISRQ